MPVVIFFILIFMSIYYGYMPPTLEDQLWFALGLAITIASIRLMARRF